MGIALAEIRVEVSQLAAAFDAGGLIPADAAVVVRDATITINMLEAIRAAAAARAAAGGSWRQEGARSPAHQLARQTGTSVGAAKDALAAGEKLPGLPALATAARRGELSAAQVAPIADAAAADPSAEARLVEKAKRASLGELRDECARVKAAAEPDDEARHAAIHRRRFLRQRRCADGSGELHYRSTVDEVAEIMAVVRGYGNQAFDLARREGRREPEEAYLADGLLAAARIAGAAATAGGVAVDSGGTAGDAGPGQAVPEDDASGPAGRGAATATASGGTTPARRVRKPVPTKIIVHIDWDALLRGWPIETEVCEIAGLGPVPVSVVRAMMASGDAFLAGVVTKGVDVATVFHLGRKPTAYQGTALDWLSPTCTTEGCNGAVRLETDHREDWATTKVTLLRWLERHCRSCHDKKTRHGWALVHGHGKRPLVPPDDPRPPANSPPMADTG
jgi:hypothetical protein